MILGKNSKLTCSIGILIHNEAENIAILLDSLRCQNLNKVAISEIMVVSSASSDGSDDLVRSFEKKDKRIRLITEPERKGKSSAINTFLEHASEHIVVIASGDIIPAEKTIENMVTPFFEQKVGMTGCHPVPVNKTNNFNGYLVNLQWRLHHRIALKSPKLGEMVAFRKIFESIPPESAVDEASIEAAITSKGYELRYVSDAIVFNKGPETIKDFLKQRRRIAAGHLWLKKKDSYNVSTNNFKNLSSLLKTELVQSPDKIFYLITAVGLEIIARVLGWFDLKIRKKNPYKWDRVSSTKRVDEKRTEVVEKNL